MLEVADIIRLHGAAYLARRKDRLLPSHKRALQDIQFCRTPHFGGHVYECDHCGETRYTYHSCRNRSCPKCHGDQTERWLIEQRARLLPCRYYLLTFTLPAELRALAFRLDDRELLAAGENAAVSPATIPQALGPRAQETGPVPSDDPDRTPKLLRHGSQRALSLYELPDEVVLEAPLILTDRHSHLLTVQILNPNPA